MRSADRLACRLSLASCASCASPTASKYRELFRNLRRAMLLDRLRNGRRFASVHAGDLHLGKRTQQYVTRSEEHTSELQSLMRISYAVFCLKKKKKPNTHKHHASNIHTKLNKAT